jgi:hypothetical protein
MTVWFQPTHPTCERSAPFAAAPALEIASRSRTMNWKPARPREKIGSPADRAWWCQLGSLGPDGRSRESKPSRCWPRIQPPGPYFPSTSHAAWRIADTHDAAYTNVALLSKRQGFRVTRRFGGGLHICGAVSESRPESGASQATRGARDYGRDGACMPAAPIQ